MEPRELLSGGPATPPSGNAEVEAAIVVRALYVLSQGGGGLGSISGNAATTLSVPGAAQGVQGSITVQVANGPRQTIGLVFQ
jgi:hypothetical protein